MKEKPLQNVKKNYYQLLSKDDVNVYQSNNNNYNTSQELYTEKTFYHGLYK